MGKDIKGRVWQAIIKRKIELQAEHLADRGFIEQSQLLQSYLPEVKGLRVLLFCKYLKHLPDVKAQRLSLRVLLFCKYLKPKSAVQCLT